MNTHSLYIIDPFSHFKTNPITKIGAHLLQQQTKNKIPLTLVCSLQSSPATARLLCQNEKHNDAFILIYHNHNFFM